MAYSLQEGEVYQYTTTGAVSNGQLLILNRMVGVALNSATGAGKKIGVAVEGVFQVASVATGAKTAGNRAFVRTTGSQYKIAAVSGVATGAKYSVGMIWETATATSTTVKIKLVGGPLAFI